ncbi:macrophage mannose receptor 1-like [Littorina saxatilis]|uniref:C-type lectin domain-containing protein n=1 Tax=Littorina saxatilis TaxID=31220 RepID=A0AAN9BR42_9CAEN
MQMLVATLILSAVVGLGQGQITLTQCPDGWISWQSNCYMFFNNASQKITWDSAGDECSDVQGHLLRIETADEYMFIKKNLKIYPADDYWTALNDLPLNQGAATKSSFMWGNDEFPIDEVVGRHWDREPDNTPGKDCVQVSIQATLTIEDCSNKHAYICEFNRQDTESCPDRWIDAYLGSNRCYLVGSTNWTALATWAQARKTCESLSPFNDNRKARLIGITDQNVQTFLAENLPLVQSTRQVYWTGLNDIDTEGTFIWAGNGNTPFSAGYVTWRQEPNNLGGKEFCGALLPGGEWSDANCDDKKNYVCRITLNPADLYNFGCGQWTRAGQKCVYVYNQPRVTWAGAQTYCQSKGGDLYRFYDEDDLMWLRTQAQSLLVRPGYFIGLNDQQTEGTFVWTDGTEADGNLLDWDEEPNDNSMGRAVENCAVISVEGAFASTRCSRTKAGTICEDHSGSCPAGWRSWGSGCYLFDPKYRTHYEARRRCHDASTSGNGVLLALNQQPEKDFVLTQVSGLQNAPYEWWTDLNKQTKDGAWHYTRADDDDPVAIQNLVTWDSEPNNYKGNEDCVQVNQNGHLNDVKCSRKSSFICQQTFNPSTGVMLKPSKAMWILLLCLLKLWHMG